MLRIFTLTVISIVLTACATQPKLAVTDISHERWQQRQQQLSTFNRWDLRGRVVLYINDEVHSVGLNWSRQQDISTLTLEAPLSQGMVKLEINPTAATLNTSEGNRYSGIDAQQVLLQATGWSIPLTGLTSWITGINHNASNFHPDIDATGNALSLEQDNWHINYLNYAPAQMPSGNVVELPQKIYMKHSDLALKIVIDQWQNPAPSPDSRLFPLFPD